MTYLVRSEVLNISGQVNFSATDLFLAQQFLFFVLLEYGQSTRGEVHWVQVQWDWVMASGTSQRDLVYLFRKAVYQVEVKGTLVVQTGLSVDLVQEGGGARGGGVDSWVEETHFRGEG